MPSTCMKMKKKNILSHIRDELKEIDFKYIPFCRRKRMGKTRNEKVS